MRLLELSGFLVALKQRLNYSVSVLIESAREGSIADGNDILE